MFIERIGQGAMGEVWLAYDPDLSRAVAVKLLLESRRDQDELRVLEHHERLLREAKAAAKLVHPNVTTVYEAGTDDGLAYLAMEYVKGETLRGWLRQLPFTERRWRRVLDVFVAAGRGVAAAHAHGILHRDFKPDNVLMGDDGAVKVTDFGLAVVDSTRASNLSVSGSDERIVQLVESQGDLDDVVMTATGRVLGSPAYMAPEQHTSSRVDERADVFAFCASLFEALYDERPFQGRNVDEIYDAKRCGPAYPPSPPRVPQWLRATVERGLSFRAEERWPSMEALLEVLSVDPEKRRLQRRNRRLTWFGGAALVGMLAAVGVSAHATWSARQSMQCSGSDAAVETVWNAERRAQIERSMGAVASQYGPVAWRHTEKFLDAYVVEWKAAHTEACRATRVLGEQSEEALDLRMACLDRLLTEFDVAAETLADADYEVVMHAHEIVTRLDGVTVCDDVAMLRSTQAGVSVEDREQLALARRALARAETLEIAGSYAEARISLKQAEEMNMLLEDASLRTELAMVDAALLRRDAEYELAASRLEMAVASGLEQGQWAEVGDATATLVFVLAGDLGRVDEAERVMPVLEGVAARDRHLVPDLLASRGEISRARGDYEAEREAAKHALEILSSDPATPPTRLASAVNDLGNAELHMSNDDGAREAYERALAIRLEHQGADHPTVATAYNNLALLYRRSGDLEQAQALLEKTLEIRKAVYPPDHPEIGGTYVNLGNIHRARGDLDEAGTAYLEALASAQATFGENHPDTARVHNNLGLVHQRRGDYAAARREYETALAIWERVAGPEHPSYQGTLSNLGTLQLAEDDFAEAERTYLRVVELFEQTLGPNHEKTAFARENLAAAWKAQERFDEALAEQQRAIAILEKTLGADHLTVAEAKLTLAYVYLDRGAPDEGRPVFEEALRAAELKMGVGDARLSEFLIGLIQVELDSKPSRPKKAIEYARRAVALHDAAGQSNYETALALFWLARAEYASRDARQAAQVHLERALATARAADAPRLVEKIEAWVRDR